MNIEIYIHGFLLSVFTIEEPDLTGWDNCEARIKTREYYLQQFFLEKKAVLNSMKDTSFYITFQSKGNEKEQGLTS